MLYAIPFPEISPDIFSIEIGGFSFALRWYAMAYIVGFAIGYFVVRAAIQREHLWRIVAPIETSELDDLLTYIVIGVIMGGRLGFVLFYQPGYYFENPGEILKIWTGGMSFHGGLIGVIIALIVFSVVKRTIFLSVADLLGLVTPIGLFLGRIANFVNGELWGRPTDMPWGVIFPSLRAQVCEGVEGLCARHPSQLYEALLEGLILGAILIYLAFFRGWLKRPGMITGLFLFGYGVGRFIVEFFRQADPQFITPDNPIGFVVHFLGTGVTMGQLLSLPMVGIGVLVMLFASYSARRAAQR